MAKIKTAYYCQSCGVQSPKWLGKCPSCSEWNSFVEEIVNPVAAAPQSWQSETLFSKKAASPQALNNISSSNEYRIPVRDSELNRVLGGGIVPGSLILIGGEPGIGKSTLMLQLATQFPKDYRVLYISGEESEQQIKMRAERLGMLAENCFILTETNTQQIAKQLETLNPHLLIIDSIQTLHTTRIESSPGSVSQIRECTAEFMKFAKETSTPVFLIGHITKEGSIAGPKVLEHMVDTVLQFEGDRHHIYRLLRANKNRFGSTSELGIYEMQGGGLRIVENPSELLLSHRSEAFSGIAIGAALEGIRPMLIEVQALVSSAVYGTPQRSATGFDLRRLSMLLAVLEKRCGFRLGAKDVFLNIAGGIRVEDPAIDLAVICAILSSNEDIAIADKVCLAAEVGLSGEIRPVNRIEQRVIEAEKLGFEKIIFSRYNLPAKQLADMQKQYNIELHSVAKVEEVFQLLFG